MASHPNVPTSLIGSLVHLNNIPKRQLKSRIYSSRRYKAFATQYRKQNGGSIFGKLSRMHPHHPATPSFPMSHAADRDTLQHQGAGPDALEETLGRLSKKPGVKATIVLDRTTGAVLKTNGHVASFRKANSNPLGLSSSLPGQTTGSFSSNDGQSTGFETNGIEEMAAAVWGFIQATDGLVHDLDTEVWTPGAPLFRDSKESPATA